jgi:hypothetical protein
MEVSEVSPDASTSILRKSNGGFVGEHPPVLQFMEE